MKGHLPGSAYVAITACLCVALLETIALIKGIDGQLLSVAMTILAGIGGFQLGKLKT